MVEFIMTYKLYFIISLALGYVVGSFIKNFFQKTKPEQIEKIKEWLVIAVAEAEKELGGGTGQLKLRYVYDLFLVRFPDLAKVIPFVAFSQLVDEALDKFKDMLQSNKAVQTYIEKN